MHQSDIPDQKVEPIGSEVRNVKRGEVVGRRACG
jgi:hypothetical protein